MNYLAMFEFKSRNLLKLAKTAKKKRFQNVFTKSIANINSDGSDSLDDERGKDASLWISPLVVVRQIHCFEWKQSC